MDPREDVETKTLFLKCRSCDAKNTEPKNYKISERLFVETEEYCLNVTTKTNYNQRKADPMGCP